MPVRERPGRIGDVDVDLDSQELSVLPFHTI